MEKDQVKLFQGSVNEGKQLVQRMKERCLRKRFWICSINRWLEIRAGFTLGAGTWKRGEEHNLFKMSGKV